MASSILEATLDQPHTFREWEEGSLYHCALNVTMPDGTIMSFGGKGPSARKARTLATFNASYAVKMQVLGENDGSSSSDTDQDRRIRYPQGNHFKRNDTIKPKIRVVQSDPTPMTFEENILEDRSAHLAGSDSGNPCQSDSQQSEDSDNSFNEGAPLFEWQSRLRPKPDTADERDASKPNRSPQADVATGNLVVDLSDSNADLSMFIQAAGSSRAAAKHSVNGHAASPREEKIGTGGSNIDSHSKVTKFMSEARIVDFDSDTSGSSDGDVEFVHAVPESQAKKGSSFVRKHEEPASLSLASRSARIKVDEKQPKMPSNQVSRPTQKTRAEIKGVSQVQQPQASKLLIYPDEESEDSSEEPANREQEAQHQSTNNLSTPHVQGSSSSADEMGDFDRSNAPMWLRQHSRSHALAEHDAPLYQPRQAPSGERHEPTRPPPPHLSLNYTPERIAPVQPFRVNWKHKSYIIEPSTPSSNAKNAPATQSNHPDRARPVHAVKKQSRNTRPRAQSLFDPHLGVQASDMAKMQPVSSHRVDPSLIGNRHTVPLREKHNIPAMNGAPDSLSAHAQSHVLHTRNMHSMTRIPMNPSMNAPYMPMNVSNAVPGNPQQSAMFLDPRFISLAPPTPNPYGTPSPNLHQKPIYAPSIQYNHFSPHPAANSIPGPYQFQMGTGGMLFPFGQTPRSTMPVDLESIRRAAIASAQAAVERDLPNTYKSFRERHENGRGRRTSGSPVQNRARLNHANVPDGSDQPSIQVDGKIIAERNGTHEKTSTSDSEGPRKRRRVSCKARADIVLRREERSISPVSKGKVFASLTTDIEQNAQGSVDEHDSEDYISALHSFVRKTKCSTDPAFEYAQENTGSGLWECTVRIRRMFEDQIGEIVQKTLTARTRKKAKQRASKSMLAFLKNIILESETEACKKKADLLKSSPPFAEKGRGISAAITALNQLWHWKVLQSKPDARMEEIDGGKWKCTFVLMIEDRGLVTISEIGPQKKTAKRYAAHKALDHLKELRINETEKFAGVMSLSELHDKEKVLADEVQGDEGITENIVKLSDDEDGEIQEEEEIDDFDSRFVLPKSYKLTVARTSRDCDDWVRENAQSQSDIGFYIGSFDSVVVQGNTENSQEGRLLSKNETPKAPVLCFSSQNAGLVLRANQCTDRESRELDEVSGIWLPKPIRFLLRSNRIRKHGHRFDGLMMMLLKEHGIRTRAMNDIAVTSFAVSGFRCNSGFKILWTIQELTKHWLQKDIDTSGTKNIWQDNVDIPRDLGESERVTLGIAALHACACIHVREQVSHGGLRKRTQLYGPAAEFQELSKRLMYSPFVSS